MSRLDFIDRNVDWRGILQRAIQPDVSEVISAFESLAAANSVEELFHILSVVSCELLNASSASIAIRDVQGYRLFQPASRLFDDFLAGGDRPVADYEVARNDGSRANLSETPEGLSGNRVSFHRDDRTLIIVPDWQSTIAPQGWQVALLGALERTAYALFQGFEKQKLVSTSLLKYELSFNEMRHRLKNAYASAIGLARLSMPKDAVADFSTRIRALVTSYEVVDRKEGENELAALGDLLATMLNVYQRADNDPVSISGQPLILCAREASGIGLIVNELATNALKHGAFASHRGRVAVSWYFTDGTVTFRWCETDGPKAAPAGIGSGSSLIQSIARHYLNGEADWHMGSRGVVCEIRFPLTEVQSFDN